jgi:hypothetical protein
VKKCRPAHASHRRAHARLAAFPTESRMNRLGIPLLAALLSFAGHAAASDAPIRTAAVVPYEDGVGTPALRDECDWNRTLASEIARRSHGTVVTTTEPLDALDGPVLSLRIGAAHSSGGGWGGPRFAMIRGELRQADGQVRTFEIHRSTSLGMMSGCQAMDRVGKALTKDVLNWIEDPTIFPTIEEAATPDPQ